MCRGEALGDGAEVGAAGRESSWERETALGLSSANSCFYFSFQDLLSYERGRHPKSNHFMGNTNNSIKERFSVETPTTIP